MNINIGMVIFAVIFMYIETGVFMYFTSKHIVWYEVQAGSLSTNNTYEAIAIRDETIVNATDNGYVNYFAREGARVAVGDLVYTVDESGKLNDYIGISSTGENSLSQTDLAELKSDIVGFANSFDRRRNFNSVYDFKYEMEGNVLKLSNYNILESIESIQASELTGLIKQCTTVWPGIIIYSTDGYEDLTLEMMTAEMFDKKNYEKTQLLSNDLVAAGDPVYKISSNEDWSLVIQVDKAREEELLKAEYVRVRFLKNQEVSWGKVESFTNEKGNFLAN